MSAEQQRYGLLFDVDGVLRLGTLRRQLGRLRALRSMSFRDRRSILAMPLAGERPLVCGAACTVRLPMWPIPSEIPTAEPGITRTR